ncbi:DUF4375 domain-containing protein [Coraliomargarita sp. SDUM461004]|uniref:DUF4375 domain-containing protein n=1 Tax=Thalassobacterium sedimentorum TaxID=3041258 RepID=A0ABU1ANP0_9BACT|nr:DUF4375 domain-containing protein [Coraliomargarita sp. SDUM461004]MDQ8196364.1 DUF4375 domain-containing protein [Coraliomargarita sp. SDUM461004]
MTTRIKCTQCDRMILEVTAKVNEGLCGHCKRDKDSAESRKRIDDAVQGWLKNPETLPGTNGIPMPDDIALSMAASQVRSRLFPTEEDKMEALCHKHFHKAHDKWSDSGARLLSKEEKHTLAVETFYGEVWNGGLMQYLGNESGAFADWADEAFAEIGIPEYSKLMKEVKALFPDSTIPTDPDKRWDLVEKLDEEMLDCMENIVWEKNEAEPDEIRLKLYNYLKN